MFCHGLPTLQTQNLTIENAMHVHVRSTHKTQPKNFIKITKTPNFPKKFENLGLKCMKDEEKKGLRPLSNRFELEKG